MQVLRCSLIFGLLTLVAFASLVAAESAADWRTTALQTATQGAAWLADQQESDGGWHSRTYGNLKDGAAVSSLVVYALGHLPDELQAKHRATAERGFAFLEKGINKQGAIACRDGSLDYPTYATATWLTARRLWKLPHAASEPRAEQYLLRAQLTAGRGFATDHPAFGGWDLLGAGDATGITTGSNLSVAVFVLEALQPATYAEAKQAKREALRWSRQAHAFSKDGGFPFTPEPGEHQHKAGLRDEATPRPFSYGSTTADGLRCLLLAGESAESESAVKAIAWLRQREKLEIVPGFEQLPPEIGWQRGLRFYYYQTLAKSLRYFPAADAESRRKTLVKLLADEQRANGSWQNESARMREDDPLLATAFCLVTLAELLAQRE